MILWTNHPDLRDSDTHNIGDHGWKEHSWLYATSCSLPPQRLGTLSRVKEAGECSARQSSEKIPQLPETQVCPRSESILWTNGLTEPSNSIFLKTTTKETQTRQMLLAEDQKPPVTGEDFFPQNVPNEKSVSSLQVASHTSSHTANTTLCTRSSPGEIQLQN